MFRRTGSVGKVAKQLHWNVVSLDLKKLILILIYIYIQYILYRNKYVYIYTCNIYNTHRYIYIYIQYIYIYMYYTIYIYLQYVLYIYISIQYIYWIGTTNNIHPDIESYMGVPSMHPCCNNFAVYAAECVGVGSVKIRSVIWRNSINHLGCKQ